VDGFYSIHAIFPTVEASHFTRNVKELFLFTHPFVDHELRRTDGAPDELEAQYIAKLLCNFYILETLFGILRAFVCPQVESLDLDTSSHSQLGLPPRNTTPSKQHEVRRFGERTKDERQCIANSLSTARTIG
jgi:hypothetical protein